MADKRLAIEITVEGDAVRVFREIAAAAKSSATDIESSGKRAEQGIERIEKAADGAEKQVEELEKAQTKAAKAAEQMGQQAEKSARSLDRYKTGIQQTQQGMAALGAAFGMYARQARDHEVSVMAINRIYGEAATSYLNLANQIQSTTIFSNDDALEAIRLMGTLRENYDLTDQQIQQLIRTSADLATMHGYTLTDAAMRVQSAIRGEAESAEMLGLTMNQAAIDAEGLTLTMTNAEAAQFRFNAMMKQTASSVGFAAEAADTTAGRVQQLANQTQDAALSFVRFTGPVGEAAGALGSFGLEAGLALGGLVRLGQGVRTLTTVAGGAKVVGSLTSLIGGVGGSGGLAAAITAAGAAAIIAAPAIVTLGGAVAYLALTQDDLMDSIDAQTDAIGRWTATLGKGGEALNQATFFAQDFRDLLTTIQLIDPWTGILQAPTTLNTLFDELMSLSPDSVRQVEEALNQLGYSLGNLDQWANDSAAMSEIAQIVVNAWASQVDQAAALASQIDATSQSWADYEQAQNQAAIASVANVEAIQQQATALNKLNGALQLWDGNDLFPSDRSDLSVHPMALRMATMRQFATEYAALIERIFSADDGVSAFTKQYAELDRVIERTTRSVEDAGDAFTQLTADTKGADMARVAADFNAAMQAASGLSDTLYTLRAQGGTFALDLAINTGGAQQALQSGYNAIVGGTQGMGQLAQQTWDWSNALAEGNIGQSKLDKLLLDGKISQRTYGQALNANHRIMLANESVQEDVLRIQAKQLPVMAQLAEAQARYVDELADADVQTQTVALGYMDQTKAAQAMAIATMNSTAAMAGMEDIAGKTTIAMAEADPYLKAMLLDMGLISEGADGTIKMNTDDAVSANDVLTTLNGTLDTLTKVLAQAFNVDITATDNASGTIDNILNKLINLDGKSATVAVNVRGTGGIGFLAEGYATGGHVRYADYGAMPQEIAHSIVRGAATGEHLRLVGEAGAELVSLPTGSTVTNAAGTRGRLDPQGRGRRSAGGGDVYNGTVHMTVVRDDSALTHRQRELARRRR
jgi:hypothetical protein